MSNAYMYAAPPGPPPGPPPGGQQAYGVIGHAPNIHHPHSYNPTLEIPPQFVIWRKTDGNSNDHQSIGVDMKEDPILTGRVPMFSGRMVLHDGDYKHEGKEVARAERGSGKGFVVRLASGCVVEVGMVRHGLQKCVFPFTMTVPVPGGGSGERKFAWRQIKSGFLGAVVHYELRREGPDSNSIPLATMAVHGGMGSMTKRKMGDFEFVNDGLLLGPEFRLVAVVALLRIKQKLENKAVLKQFLGGL